MKNSYGSMDLLKFEKLSPRYSCLFKRFKTYRAELKEFLYEDSLADQRLHINTTHLIFDTDDFNQNKDKPTALTLLGYVTFTCSGIGLNRRLKDRFIAKGVKYKSLPAIKIGRLCIDERYERRNIGKMIISHIIKTAMELNAQLSCRFITLDAKKDEDKNKDSYEFYNKMSFDVLEHKKKTKDDLIKQTSGQIPMFLDLYPMLQGSEKYVKYRIAQKAL